MGALDKIAESLDNSNEDKIQSFSRNPYVAYSFSQGVRKITADSSISKSLYKRKRNSGVIVELSDSNVYHLNYEVDDYDEKLLEKEVSPLNGHVKVQDIVKSQDSKYGVPIVRITRG